MKPLSSLLEKKKREVNNTFKATDDLVRNHIFCRLWITDHTACEERLERNKVKQNAKQKDRMLEEARLCLQHACSGVFLPLFWAGIQGTLRFLVVATSSSPAPPPRVPAQCSCDPPLSGPSVETQTKEPALPDPSVRARELNCRMLRKEVLPNNNATGSYNSAYTQIYCGILTVIFITFLIQNISNNLTLC